MLLRKWPLLADYMGVFYVSFLGQISFWKNTLSYRRTLGIDPVALVPIIE